MYYIRIENNNIGFVVEGIHQILNTDIKISNEDYEKFFELQSQGKQFRIKNPKGANLFEILEEYVRINEDIEIPVTLDERVENLEKENANLTFLLMESGVI